MLKRLLVHLTPMERRNEIDIWWDGDLRGGDDWKQKILTSLETADVILLLLSADFLASEFVWDKELPLAMQRHDAGAIVIPIILRDIAAFHSYDFSKLQALPTGATPVVKWGDPEEAYRDIAEAIWRWIVQNENPSPRDETEFPFVEHPVVPSLLPYLCDRSDQQRELTSALVDYVTKTPRKPFVCIVHGVASECHGDFVDRMQRTVISSTLSPDAKSLSPEPHVLPWPSNAVPPNRYIDVFRSNLGLELLNDGSATLEDIINKCIAVNERTLVLRSILYTRNFAPSPEKLLTSCLEFYRRWPNLPPGRNLIHFVCIKHESLEGRGLYEWWKMRKVSKQLSDLIELPALLSRAGVDGVVLPELKGIQLSDAVEWRYKPEVLKVREINYTEIQSLYQRPELINSGQVIPMELLAEELKTLLSKPYA